jgi:hypothetical protein
MKKIIFVFLFFIPIMCIQVHAAELKLESKTGGECNPYNFKISYTWTSEGQTIQSYDISEDGQIAIAFSNKTIGVFDNDMNFQYQISFENSGAYRVLWLDKRLLFINLRSNTAVTCDNDGQTEKCYDITGPKNYYYDVVTKRLRKQGSDRYYCTNNNGGNNPLMYYRYYTKLIRISKEREEILYKVDTPFDGAFEVRLVIFGYISIYVISILVVVIWKLRGRFCKKKREWM